MPVLYIRIIFVVLLEQRLKYAGRNLKHDLSQILSPSGAIRLLPLSRRGTLEDIYGLGE
jgi:hypothetical protein